MAAEDVRVLCWTVKNFIAENVGTYDVTDVLVNPSFESGAADGWTFEKSTDSGVKSATKNPYPMTGSDGAYLFNIWPDGNPLTQNVNLPAGNYRLKAAVASSTGLKVSMFARNSEGYETETIVDGIADGTGIEASVLFYTNGETTIGVRGVGNWYKVDNFHLYKVDEPYPIAMTSEEKSGWICPNYAESGTAVVVTYNGDKTVKRVTAEVVEGEDHTYELTSENGKTWTLASMPETELEVFVEYYQEGSIAYKTTSVEKTVGDEAFTNGLTLTGDGTVSYKTSDEKVATVSETGEVTIVGVGEATITASVENGEEYNYKTKTAKYTVRVSATTKLGETLAEREEWEEKEEGPWYDMTGAAHTEKPARKGLYIHNGKKTLVR